MSTRLSIVVQPLLLILRVNLRHTLPHIFLAFLDWLATEQPDVLRQRYSVCLATFRCMERRIYKDSEHIPDQVFFRRAFQHEKQPGLQHHE